ncbi:unnamed protein product [Ectocarpus sp. 4 AP-2014]
MKDMTPHFLCPVDMEKVPCGMNGEGYRFRERRSWVKKLAPALQVAVVTAKVALNVVGGLDVDISDFLQAVKDGLVEEMVEEALFRVVKGDENAGADMQRDASGSYEVFKKIMDTKLRQREEYRGLRRLRRLSGDNAARQRWKGRNGMGAGRKRSTVARLPFFCCAIVERIIGENQRGELWTVRRNTEVR